MQMIFIFFAGLLFGLGLIISGMNNPKNVIGFFDIVGNWNPSLAFVMLGAIPISFMGFRWVEKRSQTIFGEPLHMPGKTHLNKQLILGSIIFGMGWGIVGFCPGPALLALGAGQFKAFIFIVAMMIGMILYDTLLRNNQR